MAAPRMLVNCLQGSRKMSGTDPEGPEKQALRGTVTVLDKQVTSKLRCIHSTKSSSRGQTASSRDTTSGDGAQHPGPWLLAPSPPQRHRKHGSPRPPKWAKPRVSLSGVSVQCHGRGGCRRTQRKVKPTPNH